MFGLFKKKSPVDKLQQRYEKLMHEAYLLSTSNRKASDEKYAQAEKISAQINELTNNS